MSTDFVSLDALGIRSAIGTSGKFGPIPKGSRILLLLPPFYTPYTPPLGISVLKSFLEDDGYHVRCFDFNTIPRIWVAHHKYFENLQRLKGLTPQHGYTNLWYILQAHLLAHVNGLDSAACARLLEKVLPVYELEPSSEVINCLTPIVNRLFRDISSVLSNELDLSSYAMVGVSAYSTSLGPSLYVLEQIKKTNPSVVTVMGGGAFADDLAIGSENHATLIREYGFVDHFVVGEGELLVRSLLDGSLRGKRVLTREDLPNSVLSMREVKPPDYSDFHIPHYLHLCIEGGRSCPFQCKFCSETVQWGDYRKKPLGVLADQMIALAQKHGNKTFFMGDSLMNPYIEDLSKSLLERGAGILWDGYLRADKIATDPARVMRWAKSGCVRTRLGVESASPKVLNAMKKDTAPETISKVVKTLAGAGIRVTTLWIVGFPGETEEDFALTLEFIREHHRYIYELDVHYYYYYPYGQVWSRLHQCYPLYSPDVARHIKFQQWEIENCDPPRRVKFDRLRRINDLATELGIPNLHTLTARYRAEERWQLLWPLPAEFFEGTLVARKPASQEQPPVSLLGDSAVMADGAGSPAAYSVRVNKPLDPDILRRSVETLVQYNEALQLTPAGNSSAREAPHDAGHRLLLMSDAEAGHEAEKAIDLLRSLEPLGPSFGESIRIVAVRSSERTQVILTAHRAVADGRSVVLFFEDLYRIYEQLAAGKHVTLRQPDASFGDALQKAKPAGSLGSSEKREAAQCFVQVASPIDLVRLITPGFQQEIGVPFASCLFGGVVAAASEAGSGDPITLDVYADCRMVNVDAAHTAAPLHRSVSLSTSGSTGGSIVETIQGYDRQLKDALTRNSAGLSPEVFVDLEAVTAAPWMGDEWIPLGFLRGEERLRRAPVDIEVVLESGQVKFDITYDRSRTQFVQNLQSALGALGGNVWERLMDPQRRKMPEVTPAIAAAAPGSGRAFSRRERRPVSSSELVELTTMQGEAEWYPAVISRKEADLDAAGWARANRDWIDTILRRQHAILFRGFDMPSRDSFRQFASEVTGNLLEFSERAAPRIEVASRVYTSTEYPPEYPIPLHHENAFAYKWPMKILFYCEVPAAQGGETPIAHDRVFFRLLDPSVKQEFARKKIMYVRNYGIGVDLPWQEVFQTTNRSDVASYCAEARLQCEWLSDDRLRTTRVSPAIVQHPETGEDIWFNHAHLFHISNVEPGLAQALQSEFSDWDLPRNTFYGDGTPIDSAVLDHVRDCYARAAVRFPWKKQDVLLLDNMAVAHGREPFVGLRTTLVIMADSSLDRGLGNMRGDVNGENEVSLCTK